MHDLKLEAFFDVPGNGSIKTFMRRRKRESPSYLHDAMLDVGEYGRIFELVHQTSLEKKEKGGASPIALNPYLSCFGRLKALETAGARAASKVCRL